MNLDELEARLTTVAKGNPDQPILIVKKSDVPDDSVDALVALCQGVSANLKITVKTEPAFTPPAPPDVPSADNLQAPAFHMHPSMDALSTNTPAPVPDERPCAGPELMMTSFSTTLLDPGAWRSRSIWNRNHFPAYNLAPMEPAHAAAANDDALLIAQVAQGDPRRVRHAVRPLFHAALLARA